MLMIFPPSSVCAGAQNKGGFKDCRKLVGKDALYHLLVSRQNNLVLLFDYGDEY